MIFLTEKECLEWCAEQNIKYKFGVGVGPPNDGDNSGMFKYPENASPYLAFTRTIISLLQPFDSCLLWVTNAHIWASSENLHLYYRLRQSYSDHRLVEDAPGHLFLAYEDADLTSFLYLGLLFGWDMHVLPFPAIGSAFCSHDEWIQISCAECQNLIKTMEHFKKIG